MNSNTSLLTYLRSNSDIEHFLSQYSSNQLKPAIRAGLLYGIYALRAMHGGVLSLDFLESQVSKAKEASAATQLIPNIKQKLTEIRNEVNSIDSSLSSKYNPPIPNSNDLTSNKPETTQTDTQGSPKSRPQSAPPRKVSAAPPGDWRYDKSVFRKDSGCKKVQNRTLLFRESPPPAYRRGNYTVMLRSNDDFGRPKVVENITKEIYPEWWLGLAMMETKEGDEIPTKITQRDPPALPPKYKVKKEIFTQTQREKENKPDRSKTVRIEEPVVTVHTVDSMTETEPPSAFIRSTQPVKRISFINPDLKEYKDYTAESLKEEYDHGEVYEENSKRSKYEEEYVPTQYVTSPKETSIKKGGTGAGNEYQEREYKKSDHSLPKEELAFRKPEYGSEYHERENRKSEYSLPKEEVAFRKPEYGSEYQEREYRKSEYSLHKEEPASRKPVSKYEVHEEYRQPQTLECIEKPLTGDKTVKEDKVGKQLKDEKTVRYKEEVVHSNYSGWVGDFSDVVKHRPAGFEKDRSYRYSDDKKLRDSDHSSRSEYRDSSGYESSREKKFMFPSEYKQVKYEPRSLQDPSSNSASSMSVYHPTDDMKRFYAKEFTQLLDSHGINSLDSTSGRREEYTYLRPTRSYADEEILARNRRDLSFKSHEHNSPYL